MLCRFCLEICLFPNIQVNIHVFPYEYNGFYSKFTYSRKKYFFQFLRIKLFCILFQILTTSDFIDHFIALYIFILIYYKLYLN